MILLDTDVVSNLLRSSPLPNLLRRLAAVPPDQLFTSSITIGELVYGAHRSVRTAEIIRRLAEDVWPYVTVLPFDREAAHSYGTTRAQLERAGTPLPEPDLRIAAIALARSLTVATGNIRHFARIPGLNVENWLSGPPA
jgi:tRNA(fMet)-specific endonuclease VapC